MEAKSTDRKNFQISENGQLLAELIYADWLYQKAKIKILNSGEYDLSPVGFLDSRIAIRKGGNEIASLEMNWKGQMVIAFQDGKEYRLRLNGIFQNKYILENEERDALIELNAKFHWRNFHHSYDISYDVAETEIPNGDLLLALSVYATNYFIATMSGANAGVM